MNENIKCLYCSHTDYLFAKPTFLEGAARLFDFAGALQQFNYSDSEEMADFIAVSNDWKTVGCDIQVAVNKFKDLTPALHEQEKEVETETTR